MNKFTTIFFALFILTNLIAQESKLDLSFHGFVAVDAAYNTRESLIARNKHIFLYPLNENLQNGVDLNNQSSYDIDAAHSRIGAHLKLAETNGITTFALIEFDFLGASKASDDSYPRLRHAYLKLGINKIDITAGQTWHPLFLPNHYPRTVNANVGAPIHPLSRNPQITFTHNTTDYFKWSITVLEQNSFRSVGFADGSEKAGMPEIDAQITVGNSKKIESVFTVGYKKLAVPRNNDVSLPFWTELPTVESMHFQVNLLANTKLSCFRAGALYGGNLTEHVMPGGIGQVIENNIIPPKFAPINTFSTWIDINSNKEKWDPGFFVGYIENLGSNKNIVVEKSHSRDPLLASLFVISPRIKYHITPQTFVGLEYSYNSANWGKNFNAKGKPIDTDDFVNHRTLLSVRYTF